MVENLQRIERSGTFEVSIGQTQLGKKHWLSMGYGLAPALVLRDPSLSMGAKAVYAYLLTFTSSERKDVWPGRELMLKELGCNKDTLAKYMAELIGRGLVTVEQARDQGARFQHNIYRIVEWIADSRQPCSKIPCPKKPDTEKPEPVKPATNKTSIKQDHLLKQDHRQTDSLSISSSTSSRVPCLSVNQPLPLGDKTSQSAIPLQTGGNIELAYALGEHTPALPKDTLDPLQVVTDAYHCHVGVMGPSQFATLRFWIEDMAMNPEVVAYGIAVAAEQKKTDKHPPRISYIEGILRNWHNSGLASVDAVKEHEERLTAARTERERKSGMGMTREEAIAFLEVQDAAKEQMRKAREDAFWAEATPAKTSDELVKELTTGLREVACTADLPAVPESKTKLHPALKAILKKHAEDKAAAVVSAYDT